jgi:hypothetical protein
MKNTKKLYRAGSVIYDSNGNNGINVSWYNADIKTYPVKYEDIIKDYEEMPSKIKMAAIRYVDEFFTFDQLKLLEQFIKEEFAMELNFEEHHLPVKAIEIDKDNDEVLNLSFGETEEMGGINWNSSDQI